MASCTPGIPFLSPPSSRRICPAVRRHGSAAKSASEEPPSAAMDPPPSPLPRSRRPVLVFPGHLLPRSRRTVRYRGAVVPFTSMEPSVAEEQPPYFLEIDPFVLPRLQDAVDMPLMVLQVAKRKTRFGVLLPSAPLDCSKINQNMLWLQVQICMTVSIQHAQLGARFGSALVPEGALKLKQNAMATDERPIDPSYPCIVHLAPAADQQVEDSTS